MRTKVENGPGDMIPSLKRGESIWNIFWWVSKLCLEFGWLGCLVVLCWTGYKLQCLDYPLCLQPYADKGWGSCWVICLDIVISRVMSGNLGFCSSTGHWHRLLFGMTQLIVKHIHTICLLYGLHITLFTYIIQLESLTNPYPYFTGEKTELRD